MKIIKKINLESKVLIKKLEKLDEDINFQISEYNKFEKDRSDTIDKLNKINLEINSIETDICHVPLKIQIADIKKLYSLYDEQKKIETQLDKSEKTQIKTMLRINNLTTKRTNLLVPSEFLQDIQERVDRRYNREKKLDEDMIKDSVIYKIVSKINSEVDEVNRHNINLEIKQVADIIKDQFSLYKDLMKSNPLPIKISLRNYFDAIAPRIESVKKYGWDSNQLYSAATKVTPSYH